MKAIILIFSLWGSPQLEQMIFDYYLTTGKVIPHEDNEYEKLERPMYYVLVNNSTVVEYAYKGEVITWIKTGDFKYNEFLKD
jgi:hypothetical protein